MANISYSSPSRKILFLKKKKFPFGRNLDFSPSPSKQESIELTLEKKSRLRFERIDSPLFHSSILALWSGRLSRLYPRVDLSDPFTLSFIMVAEKAVRLSKEEHSPRSIQSKIGDRFVFDPRSRGLSSRCKVKCVRTCGRTTLRRRRRREREKEAS